MSIEYPRWRYHAYEPALIVHSAKEELSLGDGWYDNQHLATISALNKKPEPPKEIEKVKTKKKKAVEDDNNGT